MKDVKDNWRDDAEPRVLPGTGFLPMWVIGLLAILIFLGFSYVGLHGGNYDELIYEPYHSTNELASFLPKDETMVQLKLGERMYIKLCVVCHQANGGGLAGQYPPLAGSEWVLAPGVNRLARIPLYGVMGPIKVKDAEFNASMPSMAAGGVMSDEEVAAVLTYIRRSWGNKASPVSVEQVQKIHAAEKDRTDQYTAEELLKLPEALQ